MQGSSAGRTRGGLATRARLASGPLGEEEEGEEWSSTHGSRTDEGNGKGNRRGNDNGGMIRGE